ncbi:unnamed protein product [Phytophthora fragariaefolia]|uniref:Unnamed protein product n=1 Tax=Phytophthora fragariaefolia TaxID=1490495 RepID=A0A9W7D4Y6_9STRA|nr:unnamed protein product [Phytophthora fragariaefolia]
MHEREGDGLSPAALRLLDDDQFLAETDALLASIEAGAEPVAGPEAGRQKARAAERRRRHVRRVKSEKTSLEEQERALSDELRQLQHARKKAKALRGHSSPAPVWRAIATRQLEGRRVAEEQHSRLQAPAKNRAKAIEEIGDTMHERLAAAENARQVEARPSDELNPDDAVLFEEFLHDLDVVYVQTDAVFRSAGVDDTPDTSYRLGPERKRDGEVEYVDSLDVLFVPFRFEQMCSTMWRSMRRLYQQKHRYHYDKVVDSENTIAVKLRYRSEKASVDMLVHIVLRRYVEADRMVVVWGALSQGEGGFFGMDSDETGWCVVRPNEEVDEASLVQTVMQTFIRFIPMCVGDRSAGEVDGFQFTKVVVTSTEEDADEVARLMDSLLLDDSMTQHQA